MPLAQTATRQKLPSGDEMRPVILFVTHVVSTKNLGGLLVQPTFLVHQLQTSVNLLQQRPPHRPNHIPRARVLETVAAMAPEDLPPVQAVLLSTTRSRNRSRISPMPNPFRLDLPHRPHRRQTTSAASHLDRPRPALYPVSIAERVRLLSGDETMSATISATLVASTTNCTVLTVPRL